MIVPPMLPSFFLATILNIFCMGAMCNMSTFPEKTVEVRLSMNDR